MYAGHLDLSQPILWTLDDVLTPAECAAFIARYEALGDRVEVAPIHGTTGEAVVNERVRNNTRHIFIDAELAATIFARVAHQLPPTFQGARLLGLNDWWRIYRYQPGQRHGAHWDTPIELDHDISSKLTFVIYLNDDFTGGHTTFTELGDTVRPATGRALLFQQRVLHEAEAVTQGTKYALRSEVMYQGAGVRAGEGREAGGVRAGGR